MANTTKCQHLWLKCCFFYNFISRNMIVMLMSPRENCSHHGNNLFNHTAPSFWSNCYQTGTIILSEGTGHTSRCQGPNTMPNLLYLPMCFTSLNFRIVSFYSLHSWETIIICMICAVIALIGRQFIILITPLPVEQSQEAVFNFLWMGFSQNTAVVSSR